MPKAVVTDGYSIDEHIPLYLRDMFYKSSYPEYTYCTTNGYAPYDFSTNGLVLYLPLFALQVSGSNTFKSVDAYEHTCTQIGTLWNPNSKYLDGIDNAITVTDHAAFNITTTLSAMAWVNTDDYAAGTSKALLSKYDTGGDKREWAIYLLTDGKIRIYFGDPNDGTFEGVQVTDNAVLTDTWLLIGFTYNVGTVVIYVNGVAVDSSLLAGGAIPITLYNNTAPVKAGCWLDAGANASFLTGYIGENWIYSRALAAAEMLHNYNCSAWRYR